MKHFIALLASASLLGCGTRPPLPPECEGALSPINVQTGAATTGAAHEPRTNP
jgi:hypothetical protein